MRETGLASRERRTAPQVIIADRGVDACVIEADGVELLILSPNQTLSSAVAAAARALPNWGREDLRALIRPQFPGPDLDVDGILPGYSDRSAHEELHRKQARRARLTYAVTGLIVVALLVLVSVTAAFSMGAPLP